MDLLMNELVGRSLAQERERELAVTHRQREELARRPRIRRRPQPPRRRPGNVVVAPA